MVNTTIKRTISSPFNGSIKGTSTDHQEFIQINVNKHYIEMRRLQMTSANDFRDIAHALSVQYQKEFSFSD